MARKSKRERPSETSGHLCPSDDASAAGDRQSACTSSPMLSRFQGWRGWLLRLSLLILSPILFFGTLETCLRIVGYGYPTGFFLGPDSDGKWTTNDRFGWRFFPRTLSRDPDPCILTAKSAGTVRIFILGESAAMGVPDPAFNFGRILAAMLREQFPGVRFEVIDGAMTAINSFVVREIAGDCAARQPDLFVIYMGNNEVVGSYGPGTIFERWSPCIEMIRAGLRVKSTRVGELLGDIAGHFHSSQAAPNRWQGMDMFANNPIAADDPRMNAVYDNYRRNLIDICGIARRAGAAVVLSTVAANLGDCPPFASLHRPGLSPADLAQWESMYKAGCELDTGNSWRDALQQYEAAAKIDDRFAELQYRIARCLSKAGRFAEARERFESARDLDVLRFRVDSRINTIIRRVAVEEEGSGVRFADAERALAENDPNWHGILGERLFYEHVHLTFEGNYLLARTVFQQICRALPQLGVPDSRQSIPSRQRCAELLAFTPLDEYNLAAGIGEMTSRAPFTNQLGYDLRRDAARRRMDSLLGLALTPQAIQEARRTYEAALAKTPGDWYLHCGFARLAKTAHQPDVALEDYRIVVGMQPRNALMQYNLGTLLAANGEVDGAVASYRRALEINPDFAEAHYNLGCRTRRPRTDRRGRRPLPTGAGDQSRLRKSTL